MAEHFSTFLLNCFLFSFFGWEEVNFYILLEMKILFSNSRIFTIYEIVYNSRINILVILQHATNEILQIKFDKKTTVEFVESMQKVRFEMYRYSCYQQTGCCYLDHLDHNLYHLYRDGFDCSHRCNDHYLLGNHYSFVVVAGHRHRHRHRHDYNDSCCRHDYVVSAVVAAVAAVVADLVHVY